MDVTGFSDLHYRYAVLAVVPQSLSVAVVSPLNLRTGGLKAFEWHLCDGIDDYCK